MFAHAAADPAIRPGHGFRRNTRRTCRALYGTRSGEDPCFARHAGLTGAALAAASPVVSNDVAADPRYLTAFASTGSELIAPVLDERGRVVGTVDVESAERDAFRPDDVLELFNLTATAAPLFADIDVGRHHGGLVRGNSTDPRRHGCANPRNARTHPMADRDERLRCRRFRICVAPSRALCVSLVGRRHRIRSRAFPRAGRRPGVSAGPCGRYPPERSERRVPSSARLRGSRGLSWRRLEARRLARCRVVRPRNRSG
ncbi:MAG: GAF domain-containing protein [Vulcanimicrobiaceae bacterium]